MESPEKQARYSQWRQLVSEQEASGLSQTEFCKQHNLVVSTFGYYRRVIKSKEKIGSDKKLFSPIQIKNRELIKSSDIKIILPNGFQCIISYAMEISQIKQLMEALLSC